jgi:Transglycosylase SLT domain
MSEASATQSIESFGTDGRASGPVIIVSSPPQSAVQRYSVILIGVGLTVFFGTFVLLLQRMSAHERSRALYLERVERQIQQLDAGLTFDLRRRKLQLGMRDEIMRANPNIGLHDAYRYAEYVLEASEKYPAIEPLLLLAVGEVESGFRADAVSSKNAKGIYQIWPSTGRLLARALGGNTATSFFSSLRETPKWPRSISTSFPPPTTTPAFF